MKTIQKTLILLIITLLVTILAASSDIKEEKSEFNSETASFTLSGGVTNDHPYLSWNLCVGANLYELHRLPTGSLGPSKVFDQFDSPDSFVDEAVHGAELGTRFDQVRYVVKAYHEGVDHGVEFKNLYCTSNPVDYTADSID